MRRLRHAVLAARACLGKMRRSSGGKAENPAETAIPMRARIARAGPRFPEEQHALQRQPFRPDKSLRSWRLFFSPMYLS